MWENLGSVCLFVCPFVRGHSVTRGVDYAATYDQMPWPGVEQKSQIHFHNDLSLQLAAAAVPKVVYST